MLPFFAKAESPGCSTYSPLGVFNTVSPVRTWAKKLLCHQILLFFSSSGHLNSAKSNSSTLIFFAKGLFSINSCMFIITQKLTGAARLICAPNNNIFQVSLVFAQFMQ